jgi:hypothetical protein
MSDPIDGPARRLRVELDGGGVVEADEEWPAADGRAPVLAVRLPAARAHSLAHLLTDWATAFRLAPDRAEVPSTYALGRAIEDVTAALGDRDALACASRSRGSVSAGRRLAAVAVLREQEPALSPLQRVAVVDAAARWLDEEAGDELAYALLGAVCLSGAVTSRAYLALITPDADGEQ